MDKLQFLVLISELIVTTSSTMSRHKRPILHEKHCHQSPRNYWNAYCVNAFVCCALASCRLLRHSLVRIGAGRILKVEGHSGGSNYFSAKRQKKTILVPPLFSCAHSVFDEIRGTTIKVKQF